MLFGAVEPFQDLVLTAANYPDGTICDHFSAKVIHQLRMNSNSSHRERNESKFSLFPAHRDHKLLRPRAQEARRLRSGPRK
jgi:hypothetical protein